MQATRARTIALVSVGLLTLTLGCGSPSSRDAPEEAPTASRTPTARDTTLLPSESPPGFHIARVQLASADEGSLSDDAGRLLTLYGDPDLEDPATGPLLVVGRDWGEDWADLGCGSKPRDPTDARSTRGPVVVCSGELWVSWEIPTKDFTEECVGVMGRNVAPELVARAADALDPPEGAIGVPHEPLEIPADVLPAGMTRLASGRVWRSSSDVHTVSADIYEWKRHRPSARIGMRVTDASDTLSLLTRVQVGGEFQHIRGGPGAVHSDRDLHVLTWREGDVLVAVEARGVRRATVDAFIRSLAEVSVGKAWELKDSLLTSPPATLLAPGEKLAASGRAGKVRWAVGIRDGWETVHIHHVDDGDIGGDAAPVGKVRRDQILIRRSGFEDGELVVAHVHADVAKVVATTRDGHEIDVPLGEAVLPDESRYCGVWLDEPAELKGVTAYDAAGNRIAHATSSL
ncbi:hypothetical protein DFJ64_1547 [Thermasporomyces composti]|uniref:Uncharacterized protein n=1 Tax=Thermasporomyces composti TaxID=696763 RepID=A0A3D9V3P9_THECX|nr:hypothetical protein DFJ64_1547 [Thermasporomyces composti]